MRPANCLLGAALLLTAGLASGCRAEHGAQEQGTELSFVATDPFGPAHYFAWEVAHDPRYSDALWVADDGRSAWVRIDGDGLRRFGHGRWSSVATDSMSAYHMVLTPDGARGWAFDTDALFESVDGLWRAADNHDRAAFDAPGGRVWTTGISDDGREAWALIGAVAGRDVLRHYTDGAWRREPAADKLLRAHPPAAATWFRSDAAELWIPTDSGLIHYAKHDKDGTWTYVELGEEIDWSGKLMLARDGSRGWIGDRWQLAQGRWTRSEHSLGATLDWLSDDGRRAWAHTQAGLMLRLEHGTWTNTGEFGRIAATWFSRDGTRGYLLAQEFIRELRDGEWHIARHFHCYDSESVPAPRFALDPSGRVGVLASYYGCTAELDDGEWWSGAPSSEPEPSRIDAAWIDPDDHSAWIVGIEATLVGRRRAIPQDPPRMVRSSPTGSPFAATYAITLAPGMVIDRALFVHESKGVESPSDELRVTQLEPRHWTLELDASARVLEPNIHTHLKLFLEHEPSGFLQTWSTKLHRIDEAHLR